MEKMKAPNLRGKGISATKFTKTGEPKRAGNWSVSTIHFQSLQFRDYKVKLEDGRLIVGDHTPLADVMGVMGNEIEDLAKNDEFLQIIVRQGFAKIGSKKYESRKRLTHINSRMGIDDVRYIYREEIYTDGDFDYQFSEY